MIKVFTATSVVASVPLSVFATTSCLTSPPVGISQGILPKPCTHVFQARKAPQASQRHLMHNIISPLQLAQPAKLVSGAASSLAVKATSLPA